MPRMNDATTALAELAAEYWQAYLSAHPIRATEIGVRRFDDRLDDPTPPAIAAERGSLAAFAARAAAIDAAALVAPDVVTRSALLDQLANEAAELDAGLLDDGFEVLGVSAHRQFGSIAIRKPATAPIVADHAVATGQEAQPRLPDRMIPIEIEVMHPVLDPDQRGAVSANRIADSRSIAAPAKTDLLRGMGHARPLKRSLLL